MAHTDPAPEYYCPTNLTVTPQAVEAVISDVRAVIDRIALDLPRRGILEIHAAALIRVLREGCAPHVHMDHIGSGAFKECYYFGPDYVIKFLSDESHSKAELETLHKANRAGIGQLFLPTYSIPLYGIELPAELVNVEDDSTPYDYGHYGPAAPLPHVLTEVWIQPRVDVADSEDLTSAPSNEREYLQSPHVLYTRTSPGRIVDWEDVDSLGGEVMEWMQDVIDYYGYDFFKRAADFMWDERVSDLSARNVGWLPAPFPTPGNRGIPVILDWYST